MSEEVNPRTSDEEKPSPAEIRLYFGEAYMHCRDCGAKLYSFDGKEDAGVPCPYRGKCQ